MAAAVGIDLGTTNSVIAATEAGKPAVIANAEGSRTQPPRRHSAVQAPDQPEIEQIVDLMAAGLRARLADQNMTLDLEEDARAFIARQGFDPRLRCPAAAPLHRPRGRDSRRPRPARRRRTRRRRDQGRPDRRQAGHHLRQLTLTARHCGVPFPPRLRRTRVSPGWGSGGREVVTGIRVPSGLIRNNKSVAGGIPPSDDWVVMRAPAA